MHILCVIAACCSSGLDTISNTAKCLRPLNMLHLQTCTHCFENMMSVQDIVQTQAIIKPYIAGVCPDYNFTNFSLWWCRKWRHDYDKYQYHKFSHILHTTVLKVKRQKNCMCVEVCVVVCVLTFCVSSFFSCLRMSVRLMSFSMASTCLLRCLRYMPQALQ